MISYDTIIISGVDLEILKRVNSKRVPNAQVSAWAKGTLTRKWFDTKVLTKMALLIIEYNVYNIRKTFV